MNTEKIYDKWLSRFYRKPHRDEQIRSLAKHVEACADDMDFIIRGLTDRIGAYHDALDGFNRTCIELRSQENLADLDKFIVEENDFLLNLAQVEYSLDCIHGYYRWASMATDQDIADVADVTIDAFRSVDRTNAFKKENWLLLSDYMFSLTQMRDHSTSSARRLREHLADIVYMTNTKILDSYDNVLAGNQNHWQWHMETYCLNLHIRLEQMNSPW